MDCIAIDVGNSNIAVALFLENKLDHVERLPATEPKDLAERLTAMRAKAGEQPFGARTVPVIVSSVNPPALALVEQAIAKALDQKALVIGRDVPVQFKHAVEHPERVGTDRFVTAAAAYSVIEDAVVVADFGSATTIDVVDHYGIFLGGVILPGLAMSAHALHEHTAQLPDVTPAAPTGDYPTNTQAAIEHGIYYGAIGALRAIVERYATLLGRWPHVVLTGGFARLLAPDIDFADSFVPDLCLNGIFLAWKQHTATQEDAIKHDVTELDNLLGPDASQA